MKLQVLVIILFACIIAVAAFFLTFMLKKEKPAITAEKVHQHESAAKVIQQEVVRDPPEIKRLHKLVQEFKTDNNRWDLVLAVGDIYKNGSFPRYKPNEEIALSCYRTVSRCPNGELAGLAQTKYIDTYEHPVASVDRAGDELPVQYGREICQMAENVLMFVTFFEKPKYVVKPEPELEPIVVPVFEYKYDGQNVHDHAVSAVMKKNIDNLPDAAPDAYNDAMTAVLDHAELDESTKLDALKVLDRLSSNVHSSYGVSEKDALAKVWTKIKDSPDKIAILGSQLASGVEHGQVVCSSGRMARIVGTLDGIDNTEVARPIWAIKEELANLAAKSRETYGDGDKGADMFEKEAKDLYVSKLGMSHSIIEPLIETYKAGF